MEKSALEETPELTWKRIMEEEPFEGEHWEEIGVSNRSRRPTPSCGSDSDSGDFQSRRSEDSTLSTLSHESFSPHPNVTPLTQPINEALRNRMTVEDLQSKQYWRADWRGDVNLDASFRIADPASFGPTISRQSILSTPSAVRLRLYGSSIPDVPVALRQ
jgi:gamma-tubulin complex component 5